MALGVAGGSYYYFEIYQPGKYASFLLSLYQRLENAGLEPDTSSLKNAADYENALKVLNERVATLETVKKELSTVETPKRMINFQKEFGEHIDFAMLRHEHAQDLAEFLKSANTLHEAFEALDEQEEPVSQNQPIGDFQKILIERFSKIQTAGREFAGGEVSVVTDPSFSKLKELWSGASPGFDLVLKKLIPLNSRITLSQMSNLFTPSEQKQLNSYTPKVEDLSKKLDGLVTKYSAYDLLAFRYYPDAGPTESSERVLRFYQIMRDFEQKYGQ